jgi:cytoskeletal protein CcmA (bactofilin family)
LVGEEAVITAKVTAGTIVCKGKITGDIHVKDKMKLRAPAIIHGGVTTPMLSIEEGVLFNGTLDMEPDSHSQRETTPLHSVGIPSEPVIRRVSA